MKEITTRAANLTVRWSEDHAEDGTPRYKSEDGPRILTVFPAPFKAGKWCWRRCRMNIYWRVQDGGIADTLENAMTAAAMSLIPKRRRVAA